LVNDLEVRACADLPLALSVPLRGIAEISRKTRPMGHRVTSAAQSIIIMTTL